MTRFSPVLLAILFAITSTSAYAGDHVIPAIAVPKNRAIQNSAKARFARPLAITISSPPDQGASTPATAADFTITTTQPATICWILDGGSETCSAAGAMSLEATLFNLLPGNHTLVATATDAAGKAITSSRNWRIISE